MAPGDVKGKKRKGATDAAPKPKKQKKSDDPEKTSSKTLKDTTQLVDDAPAPIKVTRKRTEHVSEETTPANTEAAKEKKSKKKTKAIVDVSVDVETEPVGLKQKKAKKIKTAEADAAPTAETTVEVPKEKGKKSKKAKKSETEEAPIKKLKKGKAAAEDDTPVAAEDMKPKKDKQSKKPKEETQKASEDVVEADPDEGDENEDDHTAALLAGFETDGDESDLEKEDEGDLEELTLDLPKGKLKKLGKAEQNKETPGVIFVGRIPHGFYEPQMKAYFSQFGTVTRLRVSRSKKTGASKHYAFVEFASAEVAEIVAKTMDKYLMFNHILQCRVISPEQVHPSLFVGANQRFKRHPRNKMAGAEMARGADRTIWEKRIEKETKRRNLKNSKLNKELGYDFNAPTLKSVDDVPKKTPALEDPSAQQLQLEASATETAAVVHTESKPGQLTLTETKVKKSKKGKAAPDTTKVSEETETGAEEKPKKEKKRKADSVAEDKPEKETKGPKAKKVKKPKA